jgi:DMSO/TMAO reductase YedYZ molybdopterin-dependent catalytic subunit
MNVPESSAPPDTRNGQGGGAVRAGLREAAGVALVSAAVAEVVALLARAVAGVPTPTEVFGDRATVLVPLPLFSALLQIFGSNAKHIYFGSLVVLQMLLVAAWGVAYWSLRLRWRGARRTSALAGKPALVGAGLEALALAAGPWVLSCGIVAPLIGAGFFGAGLPGGAAAALGIQALPDLAFGVCFVTLMQRETARGMLSQPQQQPTQFARRRFLRNAGIALGILAGGALLWEAVSSGLANVVGVPSPRGPRLSLNDIPDRITPPPVPEYGVWKEVAGSTPEVTSAQNFYYVSKNLVSDPPLDARGWQLTIDGLVERPYTLSYAELQARPQIERYHTLACISNEVGGDLISNAKFAGTGLAQLLNSAGIREGASEVIFHAADGYSDSLHLSQALDPLALVVYRINGEALPQAHGFPARLLIPGLYGMKNGKWLTRLEVGSGGYEGYWEQRGWTREARAKTMSRIDTPRDGDLLMARPTFVAGIAYATDRGIARVDVTTDGGATWQAATLRRPLGALTWVLWELPWTPSPGQHILAVRAIDLAGVVQSYAEAAPLPDGASGYHAISVVAR